MPMVRRHILVSTHSRLKAAGYINKAKTATEAVSTHSRPKAAGWLQLCGRPRLHVSTHSRPKAAGTGLDAPKKWAWFQHTAARRRLANILYVKLQARGFNTQPPEGGWKPDERNA